MAEYLADAGHTVSVVNPAQIKAFGGAGLVRTKTNEGVAVGIARNIGNIQRKANPVDYVRQRINEFWQAPDVQDFFAAGLRGTIRIQRTVSFGADWFAT